MKARYEWIDSDNLKITNLDRLIFTKNGEFTIRIELSFLFLVTLPLKGGEQNEKEITEGVIGVFFMRDLK